ncbi:MAG TPA: hypothetical protein VLE72_01450 [Candidatus Saccharimonadales bacterium]|nr:hypothetical protein [Candidatus Saccharimonadales bacterium]
MTASEDDTRFIHDPKLANHVRNLTELVQSEERRQELIRQVMTDWQGLVAMAAAVVTWSDDAWTMHCCTSSGWLAVADSTSSLQVGLIAPQLGTSGDVYDGLGLIDLKDENLLYSTEPKMIREIQLLPQIVVSDEQRARLQIVGWPSFAHSSP